MGGAVVGGAVVGVGDGDGVAAGVGVALAADDAVAGAVGVLPLAQPTIIKNTVTIPPAATSNFCDFFNGLPLGLKRTVCGSARKEDSRQREPDDSVAQS